MNTLTPQQEIEIQNFGLELAMVETVEEMFPPDLGGVREPRVPILPLAPNAEAISLAAVYDLTAARRRREAVITNSGRMIAKISELVG